MRDVPCAAARVRRSAHSVFSPAARRTTWPRDVAWLLDSQSRRVAIEIRPLPVSSRALSSTERLSEQHRTGRGSPTPESNLNQTSYRSATPLTTGPRLGNGWSMRSDRSPSDRRRNVGLSSSYHAVVFAVLVPFQAMRVLEADLPSLGRGHPDGYSRPLQTPKNRTGMLVDSSLSRMRNKTFGRVAKTQGRWQDFQRDLPPELPRGPSSPAALRASSLVNWVAACPLVGASW